MTSIDKYYLGVLFFMFFCTHLLFGNTNHFLVGTDDFNQPCATCVWTGGVNNDWNESGNWDCGFVPGTADDAILQNAQISVNVPVEVNLLVLTSSSVVTFDSPVTTPQLIVSSSEATFNESLTATQFTVQSGTAIVNSPNVNFTNLQAELGTVITATPSAFNELIVTASTVTLLNDSPVTIEEVEFVGPGLIDGNSELIINQRYLQNDFNSTLAIPITFLENSQPSISAGRIQALLTNNAIFGSGLPFILEGDAAIIN